MDELTHWQSEIFRRDIAQQVKWMEQNGVIDAVKAAYDSGVIDALARVDQPMLIDSFNALANSGITTRKRIKASSAAELPKESQATAKESEPIAIRARRLGIRVATLERWERILSSYRPKGLTQAQIAEREAVSDETIRKDYNHMRKLGLLPSWPEKSTP
ncbi:MAG: hypothetical protein IT335_15780 [Thermomicrobiales bacterium]|nr:hypothetical protein [Thermomicrobiales bacterium]